MQEVINILYVTFISARPTTWIRIAAELLLGFAVTQSTLSTQFPTLLLAFVIVGPLFSTAAYIVNDITDINLDKKHALRRDRPIARGVLDRASASLIAITLFICAIFLGKLISIIFMIGLLLLLISQSVYTIPPIRLKEHYFFDVAVNGFSGGVRFTLGYVVGAGNIDHLPILLLLFAVCLKVVFFIGHRFQNRDLERESEFRSTVAILTISQIEMLLASMSLLTGFFYLSSVMYYHWSYRLFVPIVILFILSIPLIKSLSKGYLRNQERTLFWRVYLYTILFIFSLSFYYFMKLI